MLKFILWPVEIFNFIFNRIVLWYKHVEYGRNLKIRGRILIRGKGKIVIGDNVTIFSDYKVNPIGGNKTIFQVEKGARLTIGDRVGMSHAIITAQKQVDIEEDVLLGGCAKIYDTDFHPIDFESRFKNCEEAVRKAAVKIQAGAFIGAHAIILKGVIIGTRSVIGAGAVVAKNVPKEEIWAGNPAKKIGEV